MIHRHQDGRNFQLWEHDLEGKAVKHVATANNHRDGTLIAAFLNATEGVCLQDEAFGRNKHLPPGACNCIRCAVRQLGGSAGNEEAQAAASLQLVIATMAMAAKYNRDAGNLGTALNLETLVKEVTVA